MIKCSNWDDIVYELLEDPMIQSCGCDGLSDANRALTGLLDISWLMNDVDWMMDIHLWISSIEYALYDGNDIDIIMESINWGII